MSDAALPPDLIPCAQHDERACPSCYTLRATEAEIEEYLAIEVRIDQTMARALRAAFALRPPFVWGLRLLLVEKVRRVSHRPDLAERVERLARSLDARLLAAGGHPQPLEEERRSA